MKQAKTFKRLLSILLSLVVLVSTTVFATTVEKLPYNINYDNSETTYNEVNSGSNLLLGNAYRKTANLGDLKSGQFTITANAKKTNGDIVFSLPFEDGKHFNRWRNSLCRWRC